jgi:hypothetical protein
MFGLDWKYFWTNAIRVLRIKNTERAVAKILKKAL